MSISIKDIKIKESYYKLLEDALLSYLWEGIYKPMFDILAADDYPTAKNSGDEVDWITVKGNHIPIKKGQTKEQAVKEWVEKKEKQDKAPTIAGVNRGKPMSFKQANEGRVNPNYSKGGIFRRNCQSSVAVFEARLRGYDIETKDVNPETIRDLSFEPNLAYIDPQTGKNPQFLKSHARNSNDCKKWLEEQIKPGERYAFGYSPELSINDNGHIITAYKTNDGVLKFYDPQDGKNYDASFLDNIGYETPFGNIIICFSPMIFRLDDKELNYDILEKISQPSKKQDN